MLVYWLTLLNKRQPLIEEKTNTYHIISKIKDAIKSHITILIYVALLVSPMSSTKHYHHNIDIMDFCSKHIVIFDIFHIPSPTF